MSIDSASLRCPGDVIIFPAAPDRWIAYNVFARSSLAMNTRALEVLGSAAGLGADVSFEGAELYELWDVEWFSNDEGLLADPTRLNRDQIERTEPERVNRRALISRFEEHSLLIADETAYRARFADKTSLLDRKHFGNFHQQVGQQLMIKRRESPAGWWLKQKFNEDLTALRANLYGAVQGHALSQYIKQRFGPGETVVDIGCGPGFYSNMIAKTGAQVVGIDPNEDYVALARKHAPKGARYEVMDVGVPGGCDALESGIADTIFISDTLLFYFVPPDPAHVPNLSVLFAEIRRILKPNGRLVCVEPHYLFWLAPWLGEPDRPFTVLTEYRNRRFKVTPTFETFVQSFSKGGFAVTWMEELYPGAGFEEVDSRAYGFAAEFPVWHLFEFANLSNGSSGQGNAPAR